MPNVTETYYKEQNGSSSNLKDFAGRKPNKGHITSKNKPKKNKSNSQLSSQNLPSITIRKRKASTTKNLYEAYSSVLRKRRKTRALFKKNMS